MSAETATVSAAAAASAASSAAELAAAERELHAAKQRLNATLNALQQVRAVRAWAASHTASYVWAASYGSHCEGCVRRQVRFTLSNRAAQLKEVSSKVRARMRVCVCVCVCARTLHVCTHGGPRADRRADAGALVARANGDVEGGGQRASKRARRARVGAGAVVCCAHVYVCVCVCACACLFVGVFVCACACAHLCVCVCVNVCVCLWVAGRARQVVSRVCAHAHRWVAWPPSRALFWA